MYAHYFLILLSTLSSAPDWQRYHRRRRLLKSWNQNCQCSARVPTNASYRIVPSQRGYCSSLWAYQSQSIIMMSAHTRVGFFQIRGFHNGKRLELNATRWRRRVFGTTRWFTIACLLGKQMKLSENLAISHQIMRKTLPRGAVQSTLCQLGCFHTR